MGEDICWGGEAVGRLTHTRTKEEEGDPWAAASCLERNMTEAKSDEWLLLHPSSGRAHL